MLDEHQRVAVIELAKRGLGTRAIARTLGLSRSAVKEVLRTGDVAPPKIVRPEKAAPYRDDILELYSRCQGNLVRVHEELTKSGAVLSYQALTGFCRRHGIGHVPKVPAGRYEFGPGEEMQHDTSPHPVVIGKRKCKAHISSLVLCYSRMLFFQFYPHFTRFECKVFLTDAIVYFDGSAERCMIDNTNVVRLKGTGNDMIPVPEMAAFGERFGFIFVAHEVGDANRSAGVENPFKWIQRNFLAGRDFSDWNDLNTQAHQWCNEKNASYSRKLRASRRELFASERPHLKSLPAFVPEVYMLHQRIVDAEGYITVRRNRYSAPYKLIGRPVEVRESKGRIDVFDGPRVVASHQRIIEPTDARQTDPAHRPPRGQGRAKKGPPTEQQAICLMEPSISSYASSVAKHGSGRGVRALQKLLRMMREYPRRPLLEAIREAERYGLHDLDRLETMVLRRISSDYFIVPDVDDAYDQYQDVERDDNDNDNDNENQDDER